MIVALLSTYREGPLARAAIRSAFTCTDTVVIFEGPAGPPLEREDECPPTWKPRGTSGYMIAGESPPVHWKEGAWKTDAAKRTAMIEYCRRWRDQGPVWGVWIDGDEVLMNGEYLEDHLNHLAWSEDPAEPYMGFPLTLVELDGGVTVCGAKVLRIDLIDSYSVSSSVFKDALGQLQGRGNTRFRMSEWQGKMGAAIQALPAHERELARDHLHLPPPLPCEPYLVHRSALRHPLRAGLRMHEQEAVEIAKAQGGGG